jgi:hypothetical protein
MEHISADFFLPTFSGGMYCEVKPDGDGFLGSSILFNSGYSVWFM